MGKKLLIFLVFLVLLFFGYTKYIRMLTLEKTLVSQLSLIESVYRHKADLIFDMSKFISSNSDVDADLLEKVRQARITAAEIKLDPENITEEQLDHFRAAYKRLLDLQVELQELGRANQKIGERQEYREFIAGLDGTEIRIANERRRLNEQVDLYNKYINGFFNIAIAQVFGFREWPVFKPLLDE